MVSPELCILHEPMQPLLNGIASFSQAIFSGFIGQCTINFGAYFHDSPNSPAAQQQSVNILIRVIATSMNIGKKLQLGSIIGGNEYSFSGEKLKQPSINNDIDQKI